MRMTKRYVLLVICAALELFVFVAAVVLLSVGFEEMPKDKTHNKNRKAFQDTFSPEICRVIQVVDEENCTESCAHDEDDTCEGLKYRYSLSIEDKCQTLLGWKNCAPEPMAANETLNCFVDSDCTKVHWESPYQSSQNLGASCVIIGSVLLSLCLIAGCGLKCYVSAFPPKKMHVKKGSTASVFRVRV